MTLVEDMTPDEMLVELRKLDVEFRERQRVQTLLAAQMAFINTMLRGKFPEELLKAHCQHGGVLGGYYCHNAVAWCVHYPGDDFDRNASSVLVCDDHKPDYGGMGVSIQKYPPRPL